jgi:hypothetical protein
VGGWGVVMVEGEGGWGVVRAEVGVEEMVGAQVGGWAEAAVEGEEVEWLRTARYLRHCTHEGYPVEQVKTKIFTIVSCSGRCRPYRVGHCCQTIHACMRFGPAQLWRVVTHISSSMSQHALSTVRICIACSNAAHEHALLQKVGVLTSFSSLAWHGFMPELEAAAQAAGDPQALQQMWYI